MLSIDDDRGRKEDEEKADEYNMRERSTLTGKREHGVEGAGERA